MPSDDRVVPALAALEAPLRAFRSALVATADEVRGYVATRQSTWEARVARVRSELGPLAAGRVDAERFTEMFDRHQDEDPIAIEAMRRSLDVLTDLAARSDRLCLVEVEPDTSLHEAVDRALAEIGRAFSAARIVHEVRSGRYKPTGDDRPGEAMPFARWTRAERRLGPPLVVRVPGSALRAAALAEFLDGRQRIALVVEGECAPAGLVRLVAPGTFVLQTADAAGLGRLLRWDGPGIAALVPDGAARFVHDPAAGAHPWERVAIESLPDRPPRRAIGGLSAAQQAEELELLRTLATPPAAAPHAARPAAPGGPAAGPGAGEPADKLAAWILSRVDLSDLG